MASEYQERKTAATPAKHVAYHTNFGQAWLGDSRSLLKHVPDSSIDLVFTSPPYALQKKKEYGNRDAEEYIKWFRPFALELFRVLKESGSLVLVIGGAWTKGSPIRSLYHYKLLIDLCESTGPKSSSCKFRLAQEFYWFNPAKMPNPAEWVTVKRIRVKDAVEQIWWLSKSDFPKADNRKVLAPYSKSMKRLLATKRYNSGSRPSGWQVSDDWAKNHGGAIPPNVLPADLKDSPHQSSVEIDDPTLNMFVQANTSSMDTYRVKCREMGVNAHPAMFPIALPEFFIRFLTDPGDKILDPFAGSNTTGKAADDLQRAWVAIEKEFKYVQSSKYRWDSSSLLEERI